MTEQSTERCAPVPMHCMEIWGGNEPMDSAISVPGLDVHVYSKPHDGDLSGGDIHYVSMCAAGMISRFAVADVSGHGAGVSGLAEKLRTLMRKHINKVDQSRFASSLNDEFGRLADEGRFATAVLATYYAPTDHLVVCNAGHPHPLWYHADDRRWRLLSEDDELVVQSGRTVGIRDLPLGVIDPTAYSQFAVPLSAGDLVVFYTDAMVEAASPDGRQLGEQGLVEIANGLERTDPVSLCRELVERVAEFRGGVPSDDDETMVVLHHNAADPPKMTLGEKVRVMGRLLGIVPESGMPTQPSEAEPVPS